MSPEQEKDALHDATRCVLNFVVLAFHALAYYVVLWRTRRSNLEGSAFRKFTLVVENHQWLDAASEALLAAIVENLGAAFVLVLMAVPFGFISICECTSPIRVGYRHSQDCRNCRRYHIQRGVRCAVE